MDTAVTPLRDVVFGCCLRWFEHPMLDRTVALPMDCFVFLGDNVYGDTMNPEVLRRKYDELKRSRFFTALRAKAPILATWDDHDYGGDDAGASWPTKVESQQAFLDWIEAPPESPLRRREGIYDAHVFGPPGRRVQILLLDTRYFRSRLRYGAQEPVPGGGPYAPNLDPSATMLGSAQWSWLEEQLRAPAEFRIVASSIQFAAAFHGGEAWANFPREQDRFLDLIEETRADGLLFVSGDRHWSELSRIDGRLGYPIYDLTIGSLTQTNPEPLPPNGNRVSSSVYEREAVGRMRIDWSAADPTIDLEALDVDGAPQVARRLTLAELRAKR
jgi:alkaline phosphatase D